MSTVVEDEVQGEVEESAEEQPQQEDLQPESDAKSLELREEHYESILETEVECSELQAQFEDANEAAKAAKKNWELSVNRLRMLIRNGPEHMPLIDGPVETPDNDKYLDTPIEQVLTLTDSQREKLAGHGVKTARQFEQLRAGQIDGCPDGIRSIPGFGEAKVDQWEEEILVWLTDNQTPEPEDSVGRDEPPEDVEYEDAE